MTHAMIFSTLHDSRIDFKLLFASISQYFIIQHKIMKHKITSVLILNIMFCLFLAGCDKTETAYESAQKAIEAGDYDTALSVADAAVSASAGDKLTYRARGIAYLGKGEYELAEDSFVSALSCSNGLVESADVDISYYLAVAEFKKGDIESAKSTVDAIIALRPKDDGAYFLRGKIELALKDKEAALADFDKTVELAPSNYDRYVGIYEELHAHGYDDDASAYLTQAMSAGNKLSDYNKGVLEYYLASYTDAKADLESARQSQSNENLILYLGRTYEALGDTSYAMTLYNDFLRENPSAGAIYEQLTDCMMKNGDYEGALSTIETGLSVGNGEGSKGMMFDRVVAYEMLYDFESAKKSIAEYLSVYPDDEVAVRENVFLSSR